MRTFKLPCQTCGAMLDVPDNVAFVTCVYCGQLNGIELTEGQISLKVQDQVRKTQEQVGVLSMGVQLPYWRKELFEQETAYHSIYQIYLVKKAHEEKLITKKIRGKRNLVREFIIGAVIGIIAFGARWPLYYMLEDSSQFRAYLYRQTDLWRYLDYLDGLTMLYILLPIAIAFVFSFMGVKRFLTKNRMNKAIAEATAWRILVENKCNMHSDEIEKLKARIKDATDKVKNIE